MNSWTKIAAAVGVVAVLGVASGVVEARPFGNGGCGGPGYGMGGDAVPGMGYGPGAGMGFGHGPGMGHGHGYGPRAGPSGDPAAFADQRLSGLKSELKITKEQEPAWTAFADLAKQQATQMRAWHEAMMGSAQAGVNERIELHRQISKQRGEQFEKMAGAVKELYASLSPEQQKLADQRLRGGPGWHHF